jgi:hypothetical protein
MRVRCAYCDAEYDTRVTRTALLLVARCEQCGREGLRPVDADDAEPGPPRGWVDPPAGDE